MRTATNSLTILSLALVIVVAAGCGRPKVNLDDGDSDEPADTSSDSPSADEVTTATAETTTSPGETDTDATDPGTTWGPTDFVPRSEDGWGDTECDPFAQDCPEGEKCAPYASTGGTYDANKCVSVTGDQATGDACLASGPVEATDDCDQDNICWYTQEVDGMLLGTCVPLCMGTADDPLCPLDTACLLANNTSVTLCLPSCDPLAQDCDEGQGCYWASSDFLCLLDSSGLAAGDPCGAIDDCAAGLVCMAADVIPGCADAACCSPYCDLQLGDGPCAAVPGTSCLPYFEMNMAPPGLEQVGACYSP